MILEGRELVDDHHIVVEGKATGLDEPCRFSLLMMVMSAPAIKAALRSFGVPTQTAKVKCFESLPFPDFGRPCISGYSKWGDYQNAMGLKAVEQQVCDGSQEMTVFQDPYRAGLFAIGCVSI